MNDIKVIQLTNVGFTILDNEDFDKFKHKKWQRHPAGYAMRCQSLGKKGKHKAILLHREIMDAPDGTEVDHINGYRQDNTRRNLRLVTKSQNHGNRRIELSRPKTSQFKGVNWDKERGLWKAQIKCGARRYELGRFASEEAAARAYNTAAQKLFGEHTWLNPV
jgi:AP2 domain.